MRWTGCWKVEIKIQILSIYSKRMRNAPDASIMKSRNVSLLMRKVKREHLSRSSNKEELLIMNLARDKMGINSNSRGLSKNIVDKVNNNLGTKSKVRVIRMKTRMSLEAMAEVAAVVETIIMKEAEITIEMIIEVVEATIEVVAVSVVEAKVEGIVMITKKRKTIKITTTHPAIR